MTTTAQPRETDRGLVSRVVHFEIPIEDAARAGAFYRDTFGWQVQTWAGAEYWPMTTGAAPGPGAEGALAPRADLPEGVLVYVEVADIDRALRLVERAGGAVVTGRTPIPTIGWSARFRDTEGNVVGLFQTDTAAGAGDTRIEPAPLEDDDLAGQLASIERRMDSIGDDAQLASVDLQHVLERQQQMLQAMSAITRLLHDITEALIRKNDR